MRQPRQLPLSRSDNLTIGMARRRDPERGSKIEIFPALNVPNVNSVRTVPNDRPQTIRRNVGNVSGFVGPQESEHLA